MNKPLIACLLVLGSAQAAHADIWKWVDENGDELEINDLSAVKVAYNVVKAGDLRPTKRSRTLSSRLIVDGIFYGLVNVRTNGDRILCAVLNEKKNEWEYQTFTSRF